MKKMLLFCSLVAVAVVGWFLASPLFLDDSVDEAFPAAATSSIEMPTP
ncbi:MAG: hypothetical protein HKO62_02945, partial [Gammaproteobacteria bacterium]|nr:hypothetical protein [Gammaproteobacteria bacterium]